MPTYKLGEGPRMPPPSSHPTHYLEALLRSQENPIPEPEIVAMHREAVKAYDKQQATREKFNLPLQGKEIADASLAIIVGRAEPRLIPAYTGEDLNLETLPELPLAENRAVVEQALQVLNESPGPESFFSGAPLETI